MVLVPRVWDRHQRMVTHASQRAVYWSHSQSYPPDHIPPKQCLGKLSFEFEFNPWNEWILKWMNNENVVWVCLLKGGFEWKLPTFSSRIWSGSTKCWLMSPKTWKHTKELLTRYKYWVSGKLVNKQRKGGDNYLVSSSWKMLCRPRRKPLRSGTLRRCHRIRGKASWGWRWACTRTWWASRRRRRPSTRRSAWGKLRPLPAFPGWTWAASRGRASVRWGRWCSRRWRRSCRWGCGGWRCRRERRRDWTVRFWCRSHSWRTGGGPLRAFWSATWWTQDKDTDSVTPGIVILKKSSEWACPYERTLFGHFRNKNKLFLSSVKGRVPSLVHVNLKQTLDRKSVV